MKIIETNFFSNQVLSLEKKYKLILDDINLFKNNIKSEPFSDLWCWVYKYRIWNSSIPVWKRSWFRIIVFIDGVNYIPLLIYSKNMKNNVNRNEIKDALINLNVELKLYVK